MNLSNSASLQGIDGISILRDLYVYAQARKKDTISIKEVLKPCEPINILMG